MEDLDLNLYNYDLHELLTLFKLKEDFTKQEFKDAKNIVYAVHPDKSNLNKEYFIFFLNAYKLLLKVAEFKFRSNQESLDFENIKDAFFDKSENEIAKEFTSNKNFNKKFNELFEKHGKKSLDNGYGDWFRSDEDMDLTCEQRKENSRTLAISKEVDNLTFSSSISYGNLDNEANYGNSDLKSVYANDSVIGVTEKDLENKHRAKTLEELRKERSEKIDPLNELICEKYIEQNKSSDNTESSKRIFNLLVEEEENLKKNKNFWANLKQIEN